MPRSYTQPSFFHWLLCDFCSVPARSSGCQAVPGSSKQKGNSALKTHQKEQKILLLSAWFFILRAQVPALPLCSSTQWELGDGSLAMVTLPAPCHPAQPNRPQGALLPTLPTNWTETKLKVTKPEKIHQGGMEIGALSVKLC